MKFKKNHVRVGDTIKFHRMLDRNQQGDIIEGVGTVICQYPHFVLVRTPFGYDTAVNNVDLYTKYGWR